MSDRFLSGYWYPCPWTDSQDAQLGSRQGWPSWGQNGAVRWLECTVRGRREAFCRNLLKFWRPKGVVNEKGSCAARYEQIVGGN